MKTKKILAVAAAGTLAAMASTPANATIFTYGMTNGSKLTINTSTKSATIVGKDINARMTSKSFANFTGGAKPSFNYILDTLTGKRLVKGKWVAPNPKNKFTTHPQRLKGYGNGRFNLWAWWGNPIIGGDYITHSNSYTSNGGTAVPAPGALGLMAVALAGLFYGRRRKVKVSYNKPQFA